MTLYIIPIYILIIVIFAWKSNINAFDSFISGAREGMELCVKIFPIYLAMIFATSILTKSCILNDLLIHLSNNIPVEIFIQAILRSLSGSASIGIMIDNFKHYGVDSSIGILSSILQGSTDTTLYVVTLYFGSIGVKKYKNALSLGFFIDFVGFVVSILIVNLFIL